jgi:uridylate kinase
LKNKRILLKLSGELLKKKTSSTINFDQADQFCSRLINISQSGINLAIVIGGGNIYRGAGNDIKGYDRLIGDQIGMMATVINGLTLIERLKSKGIQTLVQSGIKIDGVVDLFNQDKVEECFHKNGIVVFCGGIGNPYFSTDTTSALRAIQIKAEFVFKATKVDGIYDKDPVIYPDAKKLHQITYDQIIQKNLGIMDLTAIQLLKSNNVKLRVFDMLQKNALEDACKGENIGTIVHG